MSSAPVGSRPPLLPSPSLCGLAALSLGLGLALALALAPSVASASASATTLTPALSHGGLELAEDGSVVSRRPAPLWDHNPSSASWSALAEKLGVSGSLWSPKTGVPLRIWGAGAPAPGVGESKAKARRFAAALLHDHIDILAPGAAASDFVLLSEDLSRGVRSVGFRQTYRGREVVGGQLSFRFKGDRLVMIASEAIPVGNVALSDSPISAEVARAEAEAWLRDGGYAQVKGGEVEGPMILPAIDRRESRFYEVMRVEVAAEAPLARAWVYVDARDGSPVAAQSHLYSGISTVHADVPLRRPGAERQEVPLRGVEVTIEGEATVTDDEGSFSGPDVPTEALVKLVSSLVKVSNDAGDDALGSFALGPGEVGLWSHPDEPELEGQLTSFVAVRHAKMRMFTIAPELEWLTGQVEVTVNIDEVCNAVSDGDSLYFFKGAEGLCEYTGRLPDVAYHELGHSVHNQSIIPGVGSFEGALSEGISDYLAVTITGDPKMAVGFFLDEEPMRDLDPEKHEWHWPEDRGQIHDEGRIIGGALWDLRKALVEKLGEADGITKTDEIWYESIRRASDIPTMYPEALLSDDDDGDLSNGTPNQCEIDRAFYIHGLVLADAFDASLTTLDAEADGSVPVELVADIAAKEECLGITLTEASIKWRVRGEQLFHDVAMESTAEGFRGLIPPQEDDVVVLYQVTLKTSDGIEMRFPDNEADPWYQRYYGPVEEIFCSGFEEDPEVEGWTLTSAWAFGAPAGLGGDPAAAYEGAQIAGIDLGDAGEDGLYNPQQIARLTSPAIDVSGYDKVRLHFQRWLQVEDRDFDAARVEINDIPAWQNATLGDPNLLDDLHHIDKEWIFQDIDITPGVMDDKAQVSFVLDSDDGLEFGGWNIDNFCLVGVQAPPAPVCGDGVVDPGEACDDGNLDAGDGCDPTCALEGGTTGSETTGAETGTSGTTGDDSATTGPSIDDPEGCACALDRGPSGGWSALALLGLFGLFGRRRRHLAG